MSRESEKLRPGILVTRVSALWQTMLVNLGIDVTPEQLQEMISVADDDGDGLIDPDVSPLCVPDLFIK